METNQKLMKQVHQWEKEKDQRISELSYLQFWDRDAHYDWFTDLARCWFTHPNVRQRVIKDVYFTNHNDNVAHLIPVSQNEVTNNNEWEGQDWFCNESVKERHKPRHRYTYTNPERPSKCLRALNLTDLVSLLSRLWASFG